jgi:hypothetical protein
MDQVTKVEPPAQSVAGGYIPAQVSPAVLASAGVSIFKGAAGIAREVSALEEGEAVLQWPAVLSPESVDELEDWLNLVVKKLRRRYGSPPIQSEGDE